MISVLSSCDECTKYIITVEELDALKIGIYISDKYYCEISTIDKNIESGYYIVKWKSESYTLQYYQKLEKDVIKTG